MEHSTRNASKLKKVKETADVFDNMGTILHNNASIPTSTTSSHHTHYDLRNGKTFIIQPSSKSAEELRNVPKCPPLLYKSKIGCKLKNNNHYKTVGARPLGKKGYLSSQYDKSTKIKYINQLFHQKQKIGEGSYGAVYAYYSLEDKNTYAIKVLSKRKCIEIKHLDVVDSLPYCIQYHNAWEEDGLVYIQLELGIMSLAEYAEKNHNISEEECWNILHDITNAMMYLHDHNYCHMDIKPENIIITTDGKYKLCDFGLLHKLSQKKGNLPMSEGDAKYIASEILQGNISAAGDVFSLGISILEIAMDLLLPMHGELWHDIRNCDWRTLAKGEKRRISIEMEQLLNWMMCSQPEQRPSALQLLGVPAIRMRSRSKKTRFNYFEEWYQKYVAQQEPDLVSKVIVDHDSTLDCSVDYENDNIKTPPRRISSILICQRT